MRSLLLSKISEILLSSPSPAPDITISGYAVDTRLLKKNDLFFALGGNRVDGHHYLFEAQKRGAIGAVVSKAYQGAKPDNFFFIQVEDPLVALQTLAKEVLSRCSSRIIAVTGSLGKTTTKSFIQTLLSSKYHTAVSPGNSNSQVGLPLSILNHTSGNEDVLILEMGMTHPGQISRLIEIAPPEVAVLTSVALVHACNFNTMEEIAWTKAEIFQHPCTRFGVIHRDLPDFKGIVQASPCAKRTFSLKFREADYYFEEEAAGLLEQGKDTKLCLKKFQLQGKHHLQNLLAAVAVARYFDLSWDEIGERIPFLQVPEGRFQFVAKNGILFLNDAYNAAELSVKAALEALPNPSPGGRKIAVLGGMTELGKFSEGCHQRVGEHALNYVESMYCLGDECYPIHKIWVNAGRKAELFSSLSDLLAYLKKDLRPSDVVLIKGSNSKQMWKLIEDL